MYKRDEIRNAFVLSRSRVMPLGYTTDKIATGRPGSRWLVLGNLHGTIQVTASTVCKLVLERQNNASTYVRLRSIIVVTESETCL